MGEHKRKRPRELTDFAVSGPMTLELAAAVGQFEDTFEDRSFSGRHLDLGKMVKCAVCSHRHRSSQVCKQTFSKDEDGDLLGVVTEQMRRPLANPYGWRPKPDLRMLLMIDKLRRGQATLVQA